MAHTQHPAKARKSKKTRRRLTPRDDRSAASSATTNFEGFCDVLEGWEYPATLANLENVIVFANSRFLSRYGYRSEQIVGLRPSVLAGPSMNVASFRSFVRTVLVAHKPWTGVLQNQDAQGRAFSIFLCAFPFFPAGSTQLRPSGFLGISTDPGTEVDMLSSFVELFTRQPASLAALGSEIPPLPKIIEGMGGQRQHEVLRLSKLGYSAKEVAAIMGITISTVNVVRWRARWERQRKPGKVAKKR